MLMLPPSNRFRSGRAAAELLCLQASCSRYSSAFAWSKVTERSRVYPKSNGCLTWKAQGQRVSSELENTLLTRAVQTPYLSESSFSDHRKVPADLAQ